MSGGSDDSDTSASTNAAVMVPVPQTTFDLSRARNAGVQPTAQTGTLAAKPAWMTGGWDNPAWGKDAATGKTLTQESMNALLNKGNTTQQTAQPAAVQQQATNNSGWTVPAEVATKVLGDDGTQWRGNTSNLGQQIFANRVAAASGGTIPDYSGLDKDTTSANAKYLSMLQSMNGG